LKAGNFRLFENNKPLEISYFNNENSPVSVGFLIDVSRSMEEKVDTSREAILTFIEESNPQNEYFVTGFHTQIDHLSEFTSRDEMTKILSANPYFTKYPKRGETVVYDAVIAGIEKLSKAKNQTKVLFVFFDASEYNNSGRYREIEKLVKEKNITIYPVAFNTPPLERPFEALAQFSGGSAILVDRYLASEPGIFYRSKVFKIRDFFMLKFKQIANQLKSQYTIGFKPDLTEDKNKWRDLKVKLELQKELKKKLGFAEAFYRKGYYPFSEMITGN